MNDKEMEFLINIQKFNSELMELNIKNEEENERLKLAISDTYETSQELLAEKEEEINRLKKELNKHIKENIQLKEENEMLTNARYSLDRVELEDRIDKAIEYINKNWGHWCSNHEVYATETINILQGSDKE